MSYAAPDGSFPAGVAEPRLQFRADGGFTILQINDTQDTDRIDVRTLQTIARAAALAKPDLVVVNGDVISEHLTSARQAEQAMHNIAGTLDGLACPWVVTFGNHDADSAPVTGLGERDQLAFYRRYRHNLNLPLQEERLGAGTMYLPILSADGTRRAYGIWLLHGGRYAPRAIAGQDFARYPTWGWVNGAQLDWYYRTSVALEAAAGARVPSLLFTHLPLWEHRFMWYAGVEGRTGEDVARAVAKHGLVGERHEGESCGPFNAGLFALILDRGETQGVFCGHDHNNSYHGNYYGVLLGFGPATGFASYGLPGEAKNQRRGARVFHVVQDRPDRLPETRVLLARDLGVDTSPDDRPGEPVPGLA
jgi:hypothetical protein